jgi:membrane protein DedA with SNARE-associated domain
MEAFILDFVEKIVNLNVYLVYFFFFISSVLQMVFPPHPGDVLLVFQGYLSTVSRSFHFFTLLLNALAGTITGTLLIYKFGHDNGERVFQYKLVKRYVDEKHLRRGRHIFEKYGAFAIFLSKFIPGINAIIILFAGMFKMRLRTVCLSAFISAVLHHTLVLLLGRILGYNLERVKSFFAAYNSTVIAVTAVVLFVLLAVRLTGRKRISPEKL